MSFFFKSLGFLGETCGFTTKDNAAPELHPFEDVQHNVHPFKLDSVKKAKKITSSVQSGAPLSSHSVIGTETDIVIPTDDFKLISDEIRASVARSRYEECFMERKSVPSVVVTPSKNQETAPMVAKKAVETTTVPVKREVAPVRNSVSHSEYSREYSSRESSDSDDRRDYSSYSRGNSSYSRSASSDDDSKPSDEREEASPVKEEPKPEPVKKKGFRMTNFVNVKKEEPKNDDDDDDEQGSFTVLPDFSFSMNSAEPSKPDVSKEERLARLMKKINGDNDSTVEKPKVSEPSSQKPKGHVFSTSLNTDFSSRTPSSESVFNIPRGGRGRGRGRDSGRGRGRGRDSSRGRGRGRDSSRGRGRGRGRGGMSHAPYDRSDSD